MSDSSTTQSTSEVAPATVEPNERSVVDLGSFRNTGYDPGRSKVVIVLWYFVSTLFFESGWFPVRGLKRWILRSFGAHVGQGVVIKPHVRIKYPWRLTVGDHCWIGQESWFDNIEDITLGDHVCVSQRVYLCTGSHDHRSRSFDLTARPIIVGNGAWLGASSLILGGVTIGANAVVAGGSVVPKDVPNGAIIGGNPPRTLGHR